MILSAAYFPPVEYFTVLAKYSSVYIDSSERYQKQSYRNRCRILTSNGPMDLRVPVVHDGARLMSDIRVDWSTPWLRQTEYAIETAYYSSPFFIYYRDPLFRILDSRPEKLWDLDMEIIDFFCSKIGIPSPARGAVTGDCATLGNIRGRGPASGWEGSSASETSSVTASLAGDEDLRDMIHPKKPALMPGREYWQVFKERSGFVPNLSIMDLLFNEGPESICYLKD